MLRFLRDVGQLGDGGLHPVSQLVLRDPRGDLGIVRLIELEPIELGKLVEHLPPGHCVEPRGIGKVEDRRAGRAELDSLVFRGKKAASPQAVVQGLVVRVAGADRDHRHERRQVGVFAPQPIGNPRTHAGASSELGAGHEERDGRIVVDGFGMHRLDKAQFVGDAGRVRQQLAEPCPRLAVTREPKPRRRDGKTCLARGHAREPLPHPNGLGQLGCPEIGQFWLIVEQVHLRRPARLEQVDDPLGPRPEVRKAGQSAQNPAGPDGLGEQTFVEQRRQRQRAQAERRPAEKGPAG